MPPITSDQLEKLLVATVAIPVLIPFVRWVVEKWINGREKSEDDLSKTIAQQGEKLTQRIEFVINTMHLEFKGMGQLISELVADGREKNVRVSQVERITEELRAILKERFDEAGAQIEALRESTTEEIRDIRDELHEIKGRVK